MVLKLLLDTKMVKPLNHYVLFYFRWVDLLNILKTAKKHVIFGWWWCNRTKSGEKLKLPSVEFDSQLVYDEKYIKTRIKNFDNKVITKFTDNEISKENTHYPFIAAICVGSVMKLEKESYFEVNLEQCKCRLKKRNTSIYLMMNCKIQMTNLKLKLNKFND